MACSCADSSDGPATSRFPAPHPPPPFVCLLHTDSSRTLNAVGRLLAVYIPVIAAAIIANLGLPLAGSAAAIGAGLFLWTLLEYGIHRFAFHGFLPHYQHHEDPNDTQYITSPLWLSGGTSLLLWALLRIPAGSWARAGLVQAAIISGYLFYEWLHLRIHANRSGGRLMAALRKRHYYHHFADEQEKGPFKNFHHRHEFAREERDGITGTLVRDIIDYEVGFGFLGIIAQKLAIVRIFRKMFEFRQQAVKQLVLS